MTEDKTLTDEMLEEWKEDAEFVRHPDVSTDSVWALRETVKEWSFRKIKLIEALKKEREEKKVLVDAANVLQKHEAEYRNTHDIEGRICMETGRAWDRMKRSGDKVRAALEKVRLYE